MTIGTKHDRTLIQLIISFGILLFSVACQSGAIPAEQDTESVAESTPDTATVTPAIALYRDPAQPVSVRVEDLLSRMTLDEKIGQMTQVEKNSIAPEETAEYFIGSILSGGGGAPDDNSVTGWVEMINGYQQAALETRLGIPIIYGVDAVHGHGNLYGATIFPHQVGLGATGNKALLRQIGQATATEILATGIPWNFAPVLAVPQDIRWGRTYEAYGENTALVTDLGLAYQEGLQALPADYDPAPGQTLYTLATPKHYLGDGGTVFGSSTKLDYLLDQGDMQMDEQRVRALFLPPYRAAVDGGALSVMPSYSSWNGTKMHAQAYWLTDVLKGELGFQGFIVSDWGALDQISFDYYDSVVTAINAGVDMNMVPSSYTAFIRTMRQAVESGDVPLERIDDSVRRILSVKFALGLFQRPFADPNLASAVGSDAHRELARQAVRESVVLLQNKNQALPIASDTPLIFVAGQGAANIGLQSGGWTIKWQGGWGDIQPGTTILEGIQAAVSPTTEVRYDADGAFDGVADVAIVVVGEFPYAEGEGDRTNLVLSQRDVDIIDAVRAHSESVVVVILSGRPLIITDHLALAEAWVAAWLPGTEGQGVADLLFGDYQFSGRLPLSWPRTMEQVPFDSDTVSSEGCGAPLFPYGYGLTTEDEAQPVLAHCD